MHASRLWKSLKLPRAGNGSPGTGPNSQLEHEIHILSLLWLTLVELKLLKETQKHLYFQLFFKIELVQTGTWNHIFSKPRTKGLFHKRFERFPKIILWKYTMSEIIFMVRISSQKCSTFAQSMVLGTHTKFQLEILARSMISAIHKFYPDGLAMQEGLIWKISHVIDPVIRVKEYPGLSNRTSFN